MVTHLKAISWVVDKDRQRQYARRKGARLRGLSELIETTIRKLAREAR